MASSQNNIRSVLSSRQRDDIAKNTADNKSFSRSKFVKKICQLEQERSKSTSSQSPSLRIGSAFSSSQTHFKVGILGAGMAGLYSGLILQSLGIDYEILEANPDRVGGRVFTVRFNGEEGKRAKRGSPEFYDYFDAGAMRFPVTKDHERMIGRKPWSLINYLNRRNHSEDDEMIIHLVPYHLEDKLGNTFLSYNRIKSTREAARRENASDLFRVGVKNGGTVPDEFAVKPFDHWTEKAFQPFLKELERSFEDGFDALMKHDVSTRCFLRKFYPSHVIDWLETRDSATGLYNMSFVETIIDEFEFSSAKWKCVDGGTDRIVDAMLNLLKSKPKLGYQVTKISPLCSGDKKEEAIRGIEIIIKKKKKKEEDDIIKSTYSHVISTLPLSVLRSLDTDDCELSYGKSSSMRLLHYDHSVKVGLRFKTRWWQRGEKPIFGGVSSTDRVARTIVYPSYGVHCKNAPGVLIASYTWSQDAARMGALPKEEIVESCLVTLETLHGNVVREEYSNCYFVQDWYNDRFAQGAFAIFGPEQFKNNFVSVLKPEVGGRLYFAGEATSVHHAWIVGALNSAYRSIWQMMTNEGMSDEWKKKLIDDWGKVEEIDYGHLQEYADSKWNNFDDEDEDKDEDEEIKEKENNVCSFELNSISQLNLVQKALKVYRKRQGL